MANTNTSYRTGYMVRMAALLAIILLMEVTGLGNIKTPALEIALFLIPVIIGAIILGPTAGAVLGGMFGAVSFWECFGRSAFGAVLLGINPLLTFVTCLIPRILAGWLCGLIFKGLQKVDKTNFVSFLVAGLSGALLNTIFFMTSLILCFGNTEFIMGFRGELPIIPFVLAFVGINGLIEAVVAIVIGVTVAKALVHFVPTRRKSAGAQ